MTPQDSSFTSAEREALIHELSILTTEAVAPERADLERLDTEQLARAMNAEDRRVAEAITACIPEISRAIDGIVGRLRRGGRLIYLGAGTAGRMGVLDASECPPTFGTDPSLVVGLIAGGEVALRSAVEDAEDDDDAAARELSALELSENDAVVGISASGRTPYVLGGLRFARTRGAFTVALASNRASAIGEQSDVRIEVVVGPEFVAGSTRLKSGTTQKLVLNMLSTISMVQLGKTYRGVMVDLRATNRKLRARSIRTVMELADVDADAADAALSAVDGSVKRALLVLITGTSPADVDAVLERFDGSLAAAIAASSR